MACLFMRYIQLRQRYRRTDSAKNKIPEHCHYGSTKISDVMDKRITCNLFCSMEDREALKREAARERQIRGAMSVGLPGNGTQNRPNRSSVLEPHASLNATLFGAPVKVGSS